LPDSRCHDSDDKSYYPDHPASDEEYRCRDRSNQPKKLDRDQSRGFTLVDMAERSADSRLRRDISSSELPKPQ
jgi:hypothetical protein